MYQPFEVKHNDDLQRFAAMDGLAPVNAAILAPQRPDGMWMLLNDKRRGGDSTSSNNSSPLMTNKIGAVTHQSF